VPTQLRRYTVAVALPALAALMLTACGGTTSSDENSSGASLAKQVEDVTAAQLKGTTIQLARFFGDCTDSVGASTDAAGAVGECPSITTLTNKFNAENEYGIKVERLGGATWDTYYDTLNTAFARRGHHARLEPGGLRQAWFAGPARRSRGRGRHRPFRRSPGGQDGHQLRRPELCRSV
jgi:hypothetical protein